MTQDVSSPKTCKNNSVLQSNCLLHSLRILSVVLLRHHQLLLEESPSENVDHPTSVLVSGSNPSLPQEGTGRRFILRTWQASPCQRVKHASMSRVITRNDAAKTPNEVHVGQGKSSESAWLPIYICNKYRSITKSRSSTKSSPTCSGTPECHRLRRTCSALYERRTSRILEIASKSILTHPLSRDSIHTEEATALHVPCEQPLLHGGAPDWPTECKPGSPDMLAAVQPSPWLRPAKVH